MDFRTFSTGIFIALGVLFGPAMLGAIIYVLIHFLTEVW